MQKTLLAITDMLIANVGFIGAAIITGFVILKGWKEHLNGEIEKLKIREETKRIVAKETSVGATALEAMRIVQFDFEKRISELENDLVHGLKLAEKERSQINESLERLKREHTEFINKSLEYFMGRKA